MSAIKNYGFYLQRGWSTVDLRKNAKITPGILTKLNKNEVVSLTMPIKICEALNCDIGDIVEVTKHGDKYYERI